MFKLALTTFTLVLMAGVARADDAPLAPITTPESCIATVEALAQSWENHKYASKAERDKVGTALHALEKQCENNQLADAQKTATELKAMVGR